MPTELLSVAETASQFLTLAGYVFFKLQRADFDIAKRQWTLTYDVGVTSEKVKKVVIDDPSGKVVQFE